MAFLEGLLWLTLNVYHEARSESQVAQMAVAHATMNRAMERRVSIKAAITQSGQFSWLSSSKGPFLPDDPKAFLTCFHSVYLALAGTDITDGATYYHAYYVRPNWADGYQYTNSYGAHLFYKGGKKKGG